MCYLELVNWPTAGVIALGENPAREFNGGDVYELISQYERISVHGAERHIEAYKHVVLINGEVHVFDQAENILVTNLGPYHMYRLDERGMLQQTT